MADLSFEFVEETNVGDTIIKVIGVGGAGGNAVDHMIKAGLHNVEFVCANTDAQALKQNQAEIQIPLGNTGLGAGAKPEQGRMCAEQAKEKIRSALSGAQMVFLAAGMGGGTGTGAGPVVAEIAKELGILTVGVVTKPFSWEGRKRMRVAEEGIAELSKHVDSLIVVLNEKLEEVLGDDVTQDDCFKAADNVLYNACSGIAQIINIPGIINVDFEDVKTIMTERGQAMMGTGEATGPDRAQKAAEQAIACPLLEGVDLNGARGILVNIIADRSLKLSETRKINQIITDYAASDANIIIGTARDDSMGDTIRVTVVATGLGRKQPELVVTNEEAVRTGTDDDYVMQLHGMSGDEQNAGLTPPSVISFGRGSAIRGQQSGKISARPSGNVDYLSVPAFLRKQAD